MGAVVEAGASLVQSMRAAGVLVGMIGAARVHTVQASVSQVLIHLVDNSEGASVAADLGLALASTYGPGETSCERGFVTYEGRWGDMPVTLFGEFVEGVR